MSKIVKGVGKAVSGVWKGVKKVFKKIVSSKLFKVVLIAVAIYFGGVALGAWGGAGTASAAVVPVTGAAPAIGSTAVVGTEAAIAADAALAAEIAATDAVVAGGTTGAFTGTAAAPVTAGQAAAADVLAPTAFAPAGGAGATGAAGAAGGAAAEVGSASIIGDAMGSVGTWAAENPTLAMMGGMGAMNMFTPNAMDVQEQQEKEAKRLAAKREINMDTSGINLGIAPAAQTSTSTSIINGAKR